MKNHTIKIPNSLLLFTCCTLQMDMNWADWVQVSNEMEWMVVLRVVEKVTAIRNHIVSIREIYIHSRAAHYSLSSIQTIRLSFNMFQGAFNIKPTPNAIPLILIISIEFVQVFWATVGNFDVTARCADIISGLSTSRVYVYAIFAFTTHGSVLHL